MTKISNFIWACMLFMSVIAGVDKALAEDAPPTTFSCRESKLSSGCEVIAFDRAANTIQGRVITDLKNRDIVDSIVASKALLKGTVVSITPSHLTLLNCEKSDWKIVTQTEESASVIVYGPSDIGSGVCGKVDPNADDNSNSTFLIALPVHVIWAKVTRYIGSIHDPMRKGPGRANSAQPKNLKDCEGEEESPTHIVTKNIKHCDNHDNTLLLIFYGKPWLFFNPLTRPGAAQYSITFSPVIGGGNQKLSYDIQVNPAFYVGKSSWIGFPITFEKDSNTSANLDSLTAAVSYDFRVVKNPNWFETEESGFIIRKPQFQLRAGPEFAPTRPRDLNFVEAEIIRLPLTLSIYRQPSAITLFPVVGLEEGRSLVAHLSAADGTIFRRVAGADASFRWPFDITHNFFGEKPVTVDFSYRMRWLSTDEPTTDVADKGPEVVSHQRHSYWRGSLNAPLSANFQFKLTVQHGSLPPDFHALDYSLGLGFTFTPSGSTEH
jgi:hypothetical protein